jgi:hypothetical protein
MTFINQWFLPLISIIISGIILIFGIASLAVVIGFLMIPSGIYFILSGFRNFSNPKKFSNTLEYYKDTTITMNPLGEIIIGIMLLFFGIALSKAFLGIVVIGIVIYFIAMFFDKK